MPHLDLNGFQRYAGQQKAWSQARFAPIEDANWQWTEKKGVVAFWPIGGQEIEPIINFKFTEIPPAEGVKGLDNPSTINGVSSIRVTRTGANLLSIKNYYEFSYNNSNYGGWTVLGNGSYYFHINYTGDSRWINSSGAGSAHWDLINLKFPKGRYKLRWLENNIETWMMIAIRNNGIYGYPAVNKKNEYVFEITDSTDVANIYFQWDKDIVYDEIGTPVLTLEEVYETEHGISDSITVPLNDTYYGGFLNLRTGELTVTHIGATLTNIDAADAYVEGNATVILRKWPNYIDSNITNTYGVPHPKAGNTIVCSHFITSTSSTPADSERISLGGYNATNLTAPIGFRINKSRLDFSKAVNPNLPTASEVRVAANAYLAQHPYQIAYELYTPYTIQLNPVQVFSLLQKDKYTPRLNTFYSDQESVQVGYRKSPIRNEFEQVQSILDLGGV